MRVRSAILAVVLTIVIPASNLRAQVTGATMSGRVTDSTGSPVANAQVDVLRPSTGTHFEVKTNESGSYTAPNLLPGTYRITVKAATFGTEGVEGLTLEVVQNLHQNFVITPGTVSHQFDVTPS